jgi:hypothetical protein
LISPASDKRIVSINLDVRDRVIKIRVRWISIEIPLSPISLGCRGEHASVVPIGPDVARVALWIETETPE